MFTESGVGQSVEVWRKAKVNSWGELPPEAYDVPHPALAGHVLHHVLDYAVFGPRTTEIHKTSPQHQPQMYSGITMFIQPEENVEADDVVRWLDTKGEYRIFRVEGNDSNDFVSPWTGNGGKEVHLGEIRPRKSAGRGE